MQSMSSALLDAARRTAAAFSRPTPANRPRRGMLLGGFALAIALAAPGQPAGAQDWTNDRWTGTWGAAPAGPPPAANLQTFTDQTLRLIVHTSIGGTRVRIRVSNEFGTRSTVDTNNRWPDWLARRLQTVRDPVLGINGRLGVVNRGISGNRLVSDSPNPLAGRSILARFDRDVLATAGARTMTLMIGINDIGNSPNTNPIPAAELIAGYRQVIARAHAKGIAVFGATLTPFAGAACYSPEKEVLRQAVSNWIRSRDEFDCVIDFDQATRAPANPARFLPAYDSGDHLHPSDLGYQAMGNAVPLTLVRSPGKAATRPDVQY